MRAFLASSALALVACGPHNSNGGGADANKHPGPDACAGLQCRVTDCAAQGKPPTSISGTVFAPNGSLPLFGVYVYVPNADPGPFMPGASCSQCASGLPGEPIAQQTSDETGHFSVQGIPDGDNIPVVITIGKWRRQLKLAHVQACTDTPIAAADTSLPKAHDDLTPNTTSVDMPRIAISTGRADSLECLVRRLGIADKEITTDQQSGMIHLYSDSQAQGAGVGAFDSGFDGGASFSDSQTLWGNATNAGKLAQYDVVILSCEGSQDSSTKPQQAMDHMKAYADMGGRIFLSHWHNIWIEGSTQGGGTQKPAVWTSIAKYSNQNQGGPTDDMIDETNNPKGVSFATWMLNVGGSPTGMRDHIPLATGTGKSTLSSVDTTKAEDWVNWVNGSSTIPQYFQFTTPNEASADSRCGKVVFSDIHVSGGPSGNTYPSSCGSATDLSPQEKALAFMFFDIASCVGTVF